MELNEAKQAVDQILNEECHRATIQYENVANEWVARYEELSREEIAAWQKITGKPRTNLWAQRHESPREVTETPHIFRLGGTNYELLMSVHGQLAEEFRPDLVAHTLRRVECGGTHAILKTNYFPNFNGYACELPLIAEFAIRAGYAEQFFVATSKAKVPTMPIAILMVHLEELFALQWNLFSNEQLAHIYEWLEPLREMADKQTHSARGTHLKMVKNVDYKPGRERESNQIVNSVDRISSYCQRGRYFYLKGLLQQNTNVEVENDKSKVEEFLNNLGFSLDMMRALNEAEKDFRNSASPFELKNCLTHLRGFIEHLHLEAAQHIAKTTAGSTHDWDTATSFLRKHNYITSQQEKLARGIYVLISDEGVHPLLSERIFARLLRNVIIEYGYMFLTIMSAKGVKLTT